MRADLSIRGNLFDGFARFYHLPLSAKCLAQCSYCSDIGAKNLQERTFEELEKSLDKAESSVYQAVVLPCNFIDIPQRQEILQRISARNFPIIVQLNRASLQRPDLFCFLEELRNFSCIVNYLFDRYEARDQPFLKGIEAAQMDYFYSTWVVHRAIPMLKEFGKLPAILRERLYFQFPYADGFSGDYFTCLEMHALFADLRRAYPGIRILPPPGIDAFDKRIPADRNLEAIVPTTWEYSTENGAIEVSVVIPTYNNRRYLLNTLRHLFIQDLPRTAFEIIVVDDGSDDGTQNAVERLVQDQTGNYNLKYVYFPRSQVRRMGDGQFRAGVARNLGVKHTSGGIIAFLDSDILTPKYYLRDLLEKHKTWDVIQAKRIQLKQEVSSEFTRIEEVIIGRDTYITDEGYWEEFQNSTRDWMMVERRWRYVCTYGLSVRRSALDRIGRIRRNYTFYGYEDTEMGFDLARAGYSFLLNEVKVFHLDHRIDRSEFHKSHHRKKILLAESAKTFFHNTLDEGVYSHLEWLFRPFLRARVWLAPYLMPAQFLLSPIFKIYYAMEYKITHGHLRFTPIRILRRMILGFSGILFWTLSFPLRKIYYFIEYQVQKRLLKIPLSER